MSDITGVQRRFNSALHYIGQKLQAFRAGPASRIPDLFTDFGRKFEAFLSRFSCFGGGEKETPTIALRQQPQPEATPETRKRVQQPEQRRKLTTDDENLAAIGQQPLIRRRQDETERPKIGQRPMSAKPEAKPADPAPKPPDPVSNSPSLLEEIGEWVSRIMEEAPAAPPAPEPPPSPPRPHVNREAIEQSIAERPDMRWVGKAPAPPSEPELLQEDRLGPGFIRNFEIPKAPRPEPTPPPAKQKAPKAPADPEELEYTFKDPDAVATPKSLEEATQLVRKANWAAEADALKEIDAAARRGLAKTGASPQPAPEPKEPESDPLEAEDWGKPVWAAPRAATPSVAGTVHKTPDTSGKDLNRRDWEEGELEEEVRQVAKQLGLTPIETRTFKYQPGEVDLNLGSAKRAESRGGARMADLVTAKRDAQRLVKWHGEARDNPLKWWVTPDRFLSSDDHRS